MPNLVAVTDGTTHTTNVFSGYASAMSLVVMGTDRYAITYGVGDPDTTTVWDSTAADIKAQIYGTDGTLITSEFDITGIVGGGQINPHLVETASGGFSAAWYAHHLTPSGDYNRFTDNNDHIRVNSFDANGNPLGFETPLEPATGSTTWNAQEVALGYYYNGSTQNLLVGSWAMNSLAFPNNGGDPVLIGAQTGISTATGGSMPGSQSDITISSFANSPLVSVAWRDLANGTVAGGQFNGVTGVMSGAWSFSVGSGSFTPDQDLRCETASLAGGQTAVIYQDNSVGVPRMRIYNADGTGGTPIDIKYSADPALPTANYAGGAVAAQALADGGVVVAWTQFATTSSSGPLPHGIYMRTYDVNGNPTGDAVLVDDFTGNVATVHDIDISVGDDGAIVVGWNWVNSNFTTYEVNSRVFRTGTERLGTATDDLLDATVAAEVFKGLDGTDTVSYLSSSNSVTASLANTSNNTGDAAGDSYVSIENLRGTKFNDFLTGNALANVLDGNGGNDSLEGGLGADTLNGGTGNHDTASYDSSASGVTVDLNVGGVNSGGDAAGDILTGIEDVKGSDHDDVIIGNGLANFLEGGAGNDVLRGGAGADRLIGGTGGRDVADYSTSLSGVTVDLNAGGTVTGGDATGDKLTGIEDVTGSNSADTLTGRATVNKLRGGGGDDTINGGGGNDFLYGDAGRDTINGGLGDDTMYAGTGAERDVFVFTDASFGEDTIFIFQVNTDKLDFRTLGLDYSDFTVTQEGLDTKLVLTADTDQIVWLKNVSATQIDNTDFLL